MDTEELSFSLPKLIVFSCLLILSSILIVLFLQNHQIQLAPIMNASAVIPLLCFNTMPGLAAILVLILFKKSLRHLLTLHKFRLGYLILGFFLFPLLAFMAASGSVLLNLTDWDFHMVDFFYDFHRQFNHDPTAHAWLQLTPHRWQMMLVIIVIAPLYALIPSFIETIGWQGFYYRLCQKKGFWFCSISAGLLWWIWQIPIILLGHPYASHPHLGLMVGLTFGVVHQIILNWLRQISHHLWPVILARATLSSAALIPLMTTTHYDRLLAHLHGVVGIIIMSFFIMLLIMFNLISQQKDSNH